MEVATWITTIATCLYALTVLGTAVYLVRQANEARLLREATVLKDVYDYIIRTHRDRAIVYENEEAIRAIDTLEALWLFERDHPIVATSIHSVANCYHYLGFLLRHRVLTAKEAVLEEAARTIVRAHDIIGRVIAIQRLSQGAITYKQYFDYLADEARAYLDRTA